MPPGGLLRPRADPPACSTEPPRVAAPAARGCEPRDPDTSLCLDPSPPAMTLPIPLIVSIPDRLGGEPCFAGTRVPVRALID